MHVYIRCIIMKTQIKNIMNILYIIYNAFLDAHCKNKLVSSKIAECCSSCRKFK